MSNYVEFEGIDNLIIMFEADAAFEEVKQEEMREMANMTPIQALYDDLISENNSEKTCGDILKMIAPRTNDFILNIYEGRKYIRIGELDNPEGYLIIGFNLKNKYSFCYRYDPISI